MAELLAHSVEKFVVVVRFHFLVLFDWVSYVQTIEPIIILVYLQSEWWMHPFHDSTSLSLTGILLDFPYFNFPVLDYLFSGWTISYCHGRYTFVTSNLFARTSLSLFYFSRSWFLYSSWIYCWPCWFCFCGMSCVGNVGLLFLDFFLIPVYLRIRFMSCFSFTLLDNR